MNTFSLTGRVRALSFAAMLASAVLVSLAAHGHAAAQARSEYLIRILTTSEAFRVRAQAALSLGGAEPSPAVTAALVGALHDDQAAVRAAAAQSLGRVGDSSAIPPLQGLARDSESAVRTAATAAVTAIRGRSSAPPPSAGTGTGTGVTPPSGPARFYVGVGDPGSPVGGIDRALLTSTRAFVLSRLGTVSGVVVAPAGESAPDATRVLRARSLSGYFLDVSITALDTRPDGAIHAAVSVVVQDYPGHNIRSMLSGAATASGVSGLSGQRAVVEAALGSALRGLATALR